MKCECMEKWTLEPLGNVSIDKSRVSQSTNDMELKNGDFPINKAV